MIRSTIISASFLATILAGCSDQGTPATAYKHAQDRIWVGLGMDGLFGHQACFRTIGGEPGRLPAGECYKMLPPQRMKGIWVNELEGSKFFPGRATAPAEGERSRIWLVMDRPALSRLTARKFAERPSPQQPRAVMVDFIGRRTAVAGRYGHMGMSDHEVVVDRIVSARIVD